jgi:hypothetical protein
VNERLLVIPSGARVLVGASRNVAWFRLVDGPRDGQHRIVRHNGGMLQEYVLDEQATLDPTKSGVYL